MFNFQIWLETYTHFSPFMFFKFRYFCNDISEHFAKYDPPSRAPIIAFTFTRINSNDINKISPFLNR